LHAENRDSIGSALDTIIKILRARTGHDLSAYKTSTIIRRIQRRMCIHQIEKFDTYKRYFQDNPYESELLFKELLIGVTSFFRDPEAWEYLSTEILPALLSALPRGSALRAWVCGCSSGEEAYSLAMVFTEALDALDSTAYTLQIFATDLDMEAIKCARQGLFSNTITANVSDQRLSRFFVPEGDRYRVNKSIREMVVFAAQNVIADPPFTKIDILICRNLLIYLEHPQQQRLESMFHYSLNPDGILFLGNAESIGRTAEQFVPLNAKYRIFRRGPLSEHQTSLPTLPLDRSRPLAPVRPIPAACVIDSLDWQVERLLLQRYCPAAVLSTVDGEIVYINGQTGKFLEPSSGKANWNLLVMAREGLRVPLATVFPTLSDKRGPISLRNLVVKINGGSYATDVVLYAMNEPAALHGMILTIFYPKSNLRPKKQTKNLTQDKLNLEYVTQLEEELNQTKQDLNNALEEMQNSNEEFKSAKEELQSANEELQSMNEELTTSREEMQSLNEELQTLNAELQNKVSELSHANDDMENLLNNTEIATIFLDEQFRIRRFTPQATAIVKLIASDVGRPLADLDSDLIYPNMFHDASEVLRTLIYVEEEKVSRAGKWFRIRLMPYRTRDNRIAGVVLTFIDITELKLLETQFQAAKVELVVSAAQRALIQGVKTEYLPSVNGGKDGENPGG